ncbi:MAG: ArsC family transcriptional regulator [Ignavibacteria bacterium]|nr:ArsC family transcriptional regulator [Ignavibacteria bacterium]
MNIQVVGTKKSSDTRKAERYFKERRIPFHFRDVSEKPLSEGELDNICRKISVDELVDTEGKEYQRNNLQYMVIDARKEILRNSELIRMPVVRNGNEVTVGYMPEVWAKWISAK